jgi:N-acetylglucosaminyl-diphospho-decaprenol L-rhamnosyltransferase
MHSITAGGGRDRPGTRVGVLTASHGAQPGEPVRIVGILINYRTSDLTLQAVEALLTELAAVGAFHVVIVDNDSQDGSFERLSAGVKERAWQDRVTVLASPRNGGYGYGINVAVRHALGSGMTPDYFHVINTDAFAGPGSVAKLVAFMDAHPDAGMAGSRILATNGETQSGAFRFPGPLTELESTASLGVISRLLRRHTVTIVPFPTESRPVDWLSGTSMLIRRQVFEQGLFFDERFFLYFEEIDFARQISRARWRNYFVADAPIEHLDSVSTGLADQNRPLPDYWFESRHRYYVKHHGRGYAAATDVAWLAGYLIFLSKRAITGRPASIRARMLRNFLRTRTLYLRRVPVDG